MKRASTIFLGSFIVIGIYSLYGTLSGDHSYQKIMPFSLLSLTLSVFLDKSKNRITSKNLLYIVGLFFSFVGDFMLNFLEDKFIWGLGSFYIAHVFYILFFYKNLKNHTYTKWYLFPLTIIMITLAYLFYEKAGPLFIPVVMYMGIISCMAFVAFQTKNKYLILGAILFLISDSFIGWDKFYTPLFKRDFLVLITYFGAQYFIYRGSKSLISKKTV